MIVRIAYRLTSFSGSTNLPQFTWSKLALLACSAGFSGMINLPGYSLNIPVVVGNKIPVWLDPGVPGKERDRVAETVQRYILNSTSL